jgi:hypothetical protein
MIILAIPGSFCGNEYWGTYLGGTPAHPDVKKVNTIAPATKIPFGFITNEYSSKSGCRCMGHRLTN